MRVEDVRMAIEPRSVGACIDLACLFYRTHGVKILGLTLWFIAPLTIVVYQATASSDFGWLWAGALFFFLSPFLGAAIVAGAGHWVFGEPFTIFGALKTARGRIWALLYYLLLSRVITGFTGLTCWGVFVVPLETRYGFLQEIVLLEQLRGRRVGNRMGEIMRHTFGTAMGRYAVIVSFAATVWISMFTVIDIGSATLLGYPIFFGRTSSLFTEELFYLFTLDPLVVTTASATLWLVYPLARLAWFFCYIDARIRKEGWDVELEFRVEALRMQATP